MINIDEIKASIEELENSDTTYENCRKLADLYIVDKLYQERQKNARERNLVQMTAGSERDVEQELSDLFPYYEKYADTKRKYQLGQIPETLLQKDLTNLCREIEEFIHILYSNTYTQPERDAIQNLIKQLQGAF